MDKHTIYEQLPTSASTVIRTTLGTTLGVFLGTTALVGAHHYYRRQQQPEALLCDYLTGVRSQLQSLSLQRLQPSSSFKRLQYTYQQAKYAHHTYSKSDAKNSTIKDNSAKTAVHLAAVPVTTMLTRPVCWVSGVASMSQVTDDATEVEGFGVVGIDSERQLVWQTTMPARVHDIVVQPICITQHHAIPNDQKRDVVVMGRRPSENFWVLDTATGQVRFAIQAAVDRHFYGHACYSLDGKLLYVTENDTVSLAGKIGVYDANDGYKKVVEFDSYGIGPHELIMYPDGETLVVANGGIKTEQASREELNIDTMRPSLVYLNRHNGMLLEQITPEHNQMSIRHLAMHDNGTVMIGIQFQGERHINVPLVLTHNRGDADFTALTMPNNQWQRFHQYIASVVVDSSRNLLCVTTPMGGCAAIYDLTSRNLIDDVSLPDCAGASLLSFKTNNGENAYDTTYNNKDRYGKDEQSRFIVSDGHGKLTTLYVTALRIKNEKSYEEGSDRAELKTHIVTDSKRHMMSFDNHLQAL